MIVQMLRAKVSDLLDVADVRLDGGRPWDIHVHNDSNACGVIT